MRKLQCDSAFGLEYRGETASEVVDVGYVGIHVVAEDEVRASSLVGNSTPECFTEELTSYRDALRLCGRSGAGGRLDTQTWNAAFHEVFE